MRDVLVLGIGQSAVGRRRLWRGGHSQAPGAAAAALRGLSRFLCQQKWDCPLLMVALTVETEELPPLAQHSLQACPGLSFSTAGRRALPCSPISKDASHVLVADAIDFGGRPGQVVRLGSADIPYYRGLKLSEHQVTFHEVLALMDLIEIKPQELLIIGVQPRSTRWGDPLSQEVEAAIPAVMEDIGRQLAVWGSAVCAVDSRGL